MEISKEIMPLNNSLYKKIDNMCTYNNLKLEVKKGLIFKVNNTNINFIEPHRFIIKINSISLVLLCYDNLNLCLYDKDIPINIPLVREMVNSIKGGIYES